MQLLYQRILCSGVSPQLCALEGGFHHSHSPKIVHLFVVVWSSFWFITILVDRASESQPCFRSLRNLRVCQVPDPTFLHLGAMQSTFPALDKVAVANGDYTSELAQISLPKLVSKDRVEKRVR